MHFLLFFFFGKMRSVVFSRTKAVKVLTVGICKWFYAPLENFGAKIFKNKCKNKVYLH